MTEADDDLEVFRHQPEFSGQPWSAGFPLGDGGLVSWRRAPDRRRHAHRIEALPVPGGRAGGLGGQPAPPQRGEQHIAAAVTGEDAPGAIAAVGGGRQAHDQYRAAAAPPSRERAVPSTARTGMTCACRRPPAHARPPAAAQARQTDCRAVSSASVPAEAASARTSAASPATGVAGVAGSSGQPVPGGTGPVTAAGRCRRATRRCHRGCRARWPPPRQNRSSALSGQARARRRRSRPPGPDASR